MTHADILVQGILIKDGVSTKMCAGSPNRKTWRPKPVNVESKHPLYFYRATHVRLSIRHNVLMNIVLVSKCNRTGLLFIIVIIIIYFIYLGCI